MKWFLFITLMAGSLFAQNPEASKIENANIICSGSNEATRVYINTSAGKVWFKDAGVPVSRGIEVVGALFSGVYSSEKYVGEILGEINYKSTPSYVTLIMRSVKNKAELEVQLYPKQDQDNYSKFFLKSCELK